MDMFERLRELLFPRKCLFCRKILPAHQTFLCTDCRENEPVFSKEKINFSFIARWTAVWYYRDGVRSSLLWYKFYHRRSCACDYARFLAMKLQNSDMDQPDLLVWVPVSWQRKLARGYDQVALITRELSKILDIPALPALKKVRHTPPQSGLKSAAERRANVLGAYRVVLPEAVAGKRVLLVDDIITTGATVSECARMLTMAGVSEITCAALAVAPHDKKKHS